jgi:hypothetical protein
MTKLFESLPLKTVDENNSDSSADDQEDCRSGSDSSDEKRYISEFHFDLSERWATAYLEKADDPLYPPESVGEEIGPSKISTFIRRIASAQPGSKSSTVIKAMSRRNLFSSPS